VKVLTLIVLPKLAKFKSEHALPKEAQPRNETVLPIVVQDNRDMLVDAIIPRSALFPKIDIPLPILMLVLRDTLEPIVMNCITLQDDPNLPNDRQDRLEARCVHSITERFMTLPCFTKPRILTPLPERNMLLILIAEPSSTKSNVLNAGV
jgi:hypothetical protein